MTNQHTKHTSRVAQVRGSYVSANWLTLSPNLGLYPLAQHFWAQLFFPGKMKLLDSITPTPRQHYILPRQSSRYCLRILHTLNVFTHPFCSRKQTHQSSIKSWHQIPDEEGYKNHTEKSQWLPCFNTRSSKHLVVIAIDTSYVRPFCI